MRGVETCCANELTTNNLLLEAFLLITNSVFTPCRLADAVDSVPEKGISDNNNVSTASRMPWRVVFDIVFSSFTQCTLLFQRNGHQHRQMIRRIVCTVIVLDDF